VQTAIKENEAKTDALDNLLLALNPIAAGPRRIPESMTNHLARANARYPAFLMSEDAEAPKGDTYKFEAEVSKVMDIIINSLYSDKDIFLRELVSNAADACDKKRFETVGEGAYQGRVRITPDRDGNTITIEDNGIGMTKEELQTNLGRIAQSGTKKFQQALEEKDKGEESSLIGQFGVGFYSAFLVADKVTVITKSVDGPQLRWESKQADEYTITDDDSPPIEVSGTRIVLSLKEDMDKYTDTSTVRQMLKKYSEFLQFPIEVWSEKTEYETVPDEAANVNLTEGEEPKTKTVPKTTKAWEKVNSAEPLWMQEPKDITKEAYTEFYKTTFGQYDDLLAQTHFSLEGQIEFRAILFVPSSVPWELSQDMFNEKVRPVKLYVKRVFISDKFSEELLPRWLQFLKGIVDSDDLPLNVSREILQKSRTLTIIRKRLIRRAIDMIKKLQEDSEKWATFNKNFGKYVKVGLIEDKDNKDQIMQIATFETNQEESTTMADIKSRMKEGQKQIYYVTGASKATAMASPALERVKAKGYEIILALNQIDEVALSGLGQYDGVDVKDATKADVDLDETDEEKKEKAETQEDFKATCDFIADVLGELVDKVEVSNRLQSSPSALVQPQYGMSPSMQRFMKAQVPGSAQDFKANLEINAKHEVIKKLSTMVAADAGTPTVATTNYAKLVYDMAAVSSGWELKDPANFAKRVAALMGGGVSALGSLDGAEASKDKDEPKEAEVVEDTKEPKEEPKEDEPITPEVIE
jgi:heat shock protein beta